MTSERELAVRAVRERYTKEASLDKYATSQDLNFREVEIEYLCKYLGHGLDVLDVGCGNGYSIARFASIFKSQFLGVDFSVDMIKCARQLVGDFKLIGETRFEVGSVHDIHYSGGSFDRVITERLLINLPTWEDQRVAIERIHHVLKQGGLYLMMEATKQGVDRLNEVRQNVGLKPIPAATAQNWWLRRLDEESLEDHLKRLFNILKVQKFGLYYLISRVIHPLLVYPDEPKFDARINEIARDLALTIEPNFLDLGHSTLFVLEKKSH